eukprot:TRINITY_DN95533_c0_g1_i1.p1 TRINITY_DN95533_c0_g1~~TRINITY_DN95533_c0_g1_i1.p1  ORF type:complete len:470 (+),score=58.92 TRINITY_DN95533_c0_g1_i1:68-1411(+)
MAHGLGTLAALHDSSPPGLDISPPRKPMDGVPSFVNDLSEPSAIMPRPPPLRDGVPLTLTYSDYRWPGCLITESTAIDGPAGVLMWWRHVEPGEDDRDLPQASGKAWHWGGSWSLSDIAGIRYTTMHGDPGTEFLNGADPKQRARTPVRGITLQRALSLVINPLSVTFALNMILLWRIFQIFPVGEDGHYNMALPANEPAMEATITACVFCCLSATVSLWWTGLFSYCLGDKFKPTHLGPKTSSRWWWQKGLSELSLEVFFCFCVSVIVICAYTKEYQNGETCHDRLSDAGRRLASDTTCIRQAGVNQTCGVGSCSCGLLSDLLCQEPPLPAQVCIKVVKPLCAATNSNVQVSGMHNYVYNSLIGTIVLGVFNFLNWCITSTALALTWMGYAMRNSKPVAASSSPDVSYHRFTVMFQTPTEDPLVFNVDSGEDPEAVAALLAGFDDL